MLLFPIYFSINFLNIDSSCGLVFYSRESVHHAAHLCKPRLQGRVYLFQNCMNHRGLRHHLALHACWRGDQSDARSLCVTHPWQRTLSFPNIRRWASGQAVRMRSKLRDAMSGKGVRQSSSSSVAPIENILRTILRSKGCNVTARRFHIAIFCEGKSFCGDTYHQLQATFLCRACSAGPDFDFVFTKTYSVNRGWNVKYVVEIAG